MTKTGADPAKVLASVLKAPPSTDASDEGAAKIDETYNTTLVATVSKGINALPGDRLIWTWIDIQPLNFEFTGYSVIATDNETLTIAQVQDQTTLSLQGQAGRTTSDTTGKTTTGTPTSSTLSNVLGTSLGATANASNQYTSSTTIAQQYEKLGADILPDELRIYRESERNLDVAGNTLINLTLKMNPHHWVDPARESDVQLVKKLTLTKGGAFVAPADVDIQAGLEKAPPHCSLRASVTLVYELRRITDNRRSYDEGKQDVQVVRKSSPPLDVVILPADSVRKPGWRVYGMSGKAQIEIELADVFGQNLPMEFTSYEQARDLAAWLNANLAWLKTDHAWKLGKTGLALSAGGLPMPLDQYFASRTDELADSDPQCVGTLGPRPARVAAAAQSADTQPDGAAH